MIRAAKPFVVLWGLPGSGKSTLARRLSPALVLPVIDKDEFLESLYESKGTGDAGWRRALSRESDRQLQEAATASTGALLVSHWRLPGMPADSGTPTSWLADISDHVVDLHCDCPAEVAAARYVRRRRHPGHLDHEASEPEILAGLRMFADVGLPEIGHRIEVDTSDEPALDPIVREILAAFERMT
jgi:glucokinase